MLPNLTDSTKEKLSLKNKIHDLKTEIKELHKGHGMFGEEVLLEIDSTLDQLIRNAEAIQGIDLKDLSETEFEAFQKTQESLLQHLVHMDAFLDGKRKAVRKIHPKSASYRIQEKRVRFEKMKGEYNKTLSENIPYRKTPILSKRRKKRLIAVQS